MIEYLAQAVYAGDSSGKTWAHLSALHVASQRRESNYLGETVYFEKILKKFGVGFDANDHRELLDGLFSILDQRR